MYTVDTTFFLYFASLLHMERKASIVLSCEDGHGCRQACVCVVCTHLILAYHKSVLTHQCWCLCLFTFHLVMVFDFVARNIHLRWGQWWVKWQGSGGDDNDDGNRNMLKSLIQVVTTTLKFMVLWIILPESISWSVILHAATTSFMELRISNTKAVCRGTFSGLSSWKLRSNRGFGIAGSSRDFARVLPTALLPTRICLFGLVELEATNKHSLLFCICCQTWTFY